ncbi:hypothetical protein ScalyP_jg6020 [Parmales sp. scaly parma]|nr:hypothetical protein ScalyP_jg6020 [Parmales sp. scaly parma]
MFSPDKLGGSSRFSKLKTKKAKSTTKHIAERQQKQKLRQDHPPISPPPPNHVSTSILSIFGLSESYEMDYVNLEPLPEYNAITSGQASPFPPTQTTTPTIDPNYNFGSSIKMSPLPVNADILHLEATKTRNDSRPVSGRASLTSMSDVSIPTMLRTPSSAYTNSNSMNRSKLVLTIKESVFTGVKSPPAGDTHGKMGRIKIICNKEVTVRDRFEIDSVGKTLCKLAVNDERDYYEYKVLPPDIEIMSDDDDSDDEDVQIPVGRFRIKIGDQFGWISEHGRYADNAYKITLKLKS